VWETAWASVLRVGGGVDGNVGGGEWCGCVWEDRRGVWNSKGLVGGCVCCSSSWRGMAVYSPPGGWVLQHELFDPIIRYLNSWPGVSLNRRCTSNAVFTQGDLVISQHAHACLGVGWGGGSGVSGREDRMGVGNSRG